MKTIYKTGEYIIDALEIKEDEIMMNTDNEFDPKDPCGFCGDFHYDGNSCSQQEIYFLSLENKKLKEALSP